MYHDFTLRRKLFFLSLISSRFRITMATITPLDPNRWSFAEPKNSAKGLPEVQGSRLRGSAEDISQGSKSTVNRKEILEKVCVCR